MGSGSGSGGVSGGSSGSGGVSGGGSSCGGSSSTGSSEGSPSITTVSATAKVGTIDKPITRKQPIKKGISNFFITTPRIKKPACLLFSRFSATRLAWIGIVGNQPA